MTASAGTHLARRICFVAARRVELEEVVVDTGDLGPDEVVALAQRSVISPGTELAQYRGDAGHGALFPGRPPEEPFVPGYATAGRVIAAGEATGLEVGMAVLAHTPHQSLVRFNGRERLCVPLPEAVSLVVAPFARLAQVGAVACSCPPPGRATWSASSASGRWATSSRSWPTAAAIAWLRSNAPPLGAPSAPRSASPWS